MALLTLLYTAPLPVGFTSGTVEVKSGANYVDANGRVNQPYKKYTLNADRTLTSLQGDATPQIVGMAMGDPATHPPLEIVVTHDVTGLPTPLRSTFRILAVDVNGTGTLNLHAPDLAVPVVGPYSPTLQALIDNATGQQTTVAAAIANANTAAGTVTAAVAAIPGQVTAGLAPVAPAVAAANAATAAVPGQVATALVPITQALADNAQTQATLLRIAGLMPWAGGDHTTLPNPAGDYLITRGAEQGQVWTRLTVGAAPTRNTALEVKPSLIGTRAQRLALAAPVVVTRFYETDTHLALTYTPGTGWRRDGDGGDPDAAVPPPDTGGY